LQGRALQAAWFQRPAPQPLEATEARQARERVYRVLDRLRERDRTLLILFEMEGLSGEEVAERMDAKLATLWVWLHRARQRFLIELGKLEGKEAALAEND
jgi:RNA polymerase sigma-70 factor (ECF subfamily)